MARRNPRLVSSARNPNTRRVEPTSEGQQQRSLEKVQRYLDTPAEEAGQGNADTKANREWLMRIWNE